MEIKTRTTRGVEVVELHGKVVGEGTARDRFQEHVQLQMCEGKRKFVVSLGDTPWLNSLRSLEPLDVNIVVPGQGPAFHDKAYLKLTADLFESIISQVHAALERGLVTLTEVQAVVNVDSIGRQYTPGAAPGPRFQALVGALTRKVHQESFDGVSKP